MEPATQKPTGNPAMIMFKIKHKTSKIWALHLYLSALEPEYMQLKQPKIDTMYVKN